MKKIKLAICVITALCMVAAVLVGCAPQNSSDKINVVCTIFPVYDWAKNVVGDNENVNLVLLLDSGVDLHSYQPTADDIVTVSTCDMFIYVGGESDEWVDDVLAQKKNNEMVALNLLEVLGDKVKEEELVEGMEGEEEEDEEGEAEYDEHVWLSLKHAQTLTSVIADKLGNIDSENKDAYTSNAVNYNAKLDALDKQFEQAIVNATYTTLVFGDRFPFRYLFDDYTLNYFAAFAGCSAESEASFETIVFLASKVDELGLKCIIKIEGSNNQIAETVKNSTETKNQTILTLNSLQSVTANDVKNGASYLSIMQQNLNVLKTAID